MLDFSPTKTTDSVTYPGERFTTKRIGPPQRASIELSLAKERAALREILDGFIEAGTELTDLIKAAGLEVDGKPFVVSDSTKVSAEMVALSEKRTQLDEEYALYAVANIKPAWIRGAFVSIESDPKVTAEMLLNSPYPDLIEEIYQTIYSGAYIQPSQAKTSPSSTTSAAAEDGKTSSTTAESAKSESSTSNETATDTSLTT
jgi:hypothetical protein